MDKSKIETPQSEEKKKKFVQTRLSFGTPKSAPKPDDSKQENQRKRKRSDPEVSVPLAKKIAEVILDEDNLEDIEIPPDDDILEEEKPVIRLPKLKKNKTSKKKQGESFKTPPKSDEKENRGNDIAIVEEKVVAIEDVSTNITSKSATETGNEDVEDVEDKCKVAEGIVEKGDANLMKNDLRKVDKNDHEATLDDDNVVEVIIIEEKDELISGENTKYKETSKHVKDKKTVVVSPRTRLPRGSKKLEYVPTITPLNKKGKEGTSTPRLIQPEDEEDGVVLADDDSIISSKCTSISEDLDVISNVSHPLLQKENEEKMQTDDDEVTIVDVIDDEPPPAIPTTPGARKRINADPQNVTPRQSKRNSIAVTPKQDEQPTHIKLTPKQVQKKLESEQKLLEKQKAKEDRERKIQEEKDKKQREKDAKEQARRDLEEKRKQEREDKERKRQAEIDLRNEEKRAKEEERRQKEDERRQKEEEKKRREEAREEERKKKELEKAEAEDKKKRVSQAFTKFFVQKNGTSLKSEEDSIDNLDSVEKSVQANFMSFQLKDYMRLAPLVRHKLTTECLNNLESILKDKNGKKNNLYLEEIRTGSRVPIKTDSTWPDDDDDVYVIDNDALEEAATIMEDPKVKLMYSTKYLSFFDNRRPAYRGSFRKKSDIINGRCPFAKDKILFDYEVDSDDEWEEEEPGESLHGSDDEKESEDDYEVDEFLVPHGHLSDEEYQDDDMTEDNTPVAQKAREQILQRAFAVEMNKITHKLKPRNIGLVYCSRDGEASTDCPKTLWNYLQRAAAISEEVVVLKDVEEIGISNPSNGADENVPILTKKLSLTADHIKELIQLLHGNTNNLQFLIEEFLAHLAKQIESDDSAADWRISKTAVKKKCRELAEWKLCTEEGPMLNRLCWCVPRKTREANQLDNVSLPNSWKYILELKKKPRKLPNEKETTDVSGNVEADMKSSNGDTLITKFANILSEEDKRKLIATAGIVGTVGSPMSNVSQQLRGSQALSDVVPMEVDGVIELD